MNFYSCLVNASEGRIHFKRTFILLAPGIESNTRDAYDMGVGGKEERSKAEECQHVLGHLCEAPGLLCWVLDPHSVARNV